MRFLNKIKEINKKFDIAENDARYIYNECVKHVANGDENGALIYDLIDALNGQIEIDEAGYYINLPRNLEEYKHNIFFANLFISEKGNLHSINDLKIMLNKIFIEHYEKLAMNLA